MFGVATNAIAIANARVISFRVFVVVVDNYWQHNGLNVINPDIIWADNFLLFLVRG